MFLVTERPELMDNYISPEIFGTLSVSDLQLEGIMCALYD